ncbi:hypothetical protein V2J09_013145 [Rumex salicifolius]
MLLSSLPSLQLSLSYVCSFSTASKLCAPLLSPLSVSPPRQTAIPKSSPIARETDSTSIRYVSDAVFDDSDSGSRNMISSAEALASAIRKASTSPVEFLQRIEKDTKEQRLVLPSPDFQRLCVDQLDLFRRIIHPNALLSFNLPTDINPSLVYVRPAGSYIMDRLELRRVVSYPGIDESDVVILVGNFSIPTGLRNAEATLLNRQAEAIPECQAIVFPMVKHPFIVGFLVAELPDMEFKEPSDAQSPSPPEYYTLPPSLDLSSPNFQTSGDSNGQHCNFSAEQTLNATNISRSLAMAHVMDQKAMLLQENSWQNNVRMSNLVEQTRGPLSTIQTLTKLLSVHLKRSETSYDIVEDIMVQGDHMRDTLQQLQDAVYLTKANIRRFNEESLKKMDGLNYVQPDTRRRQLLYDLPTDSSLEKKSPGQTRHLVPEPRDLELPMPPLALAPIPEHSTRPCNVSDVLMDLFGAVEPLAHKQRRDLELDILTKSLQVAVEEPAIRQAFGNLIEGAILRTRVGGRVNVVSMGAPAGGALVVIDDDGPDMHYMTQMHSLTPFGTELSSDRAFEDNMTWNFIAGLTVAREILESYGCVVRVISPRTNDAALGTGGTRIEVWLPSLDPPESTNFGPFHVEYVITRKDHSNVLYSSRSGHGNFRRLCFVHQLKEKVDKRVNLSLNEDINLSSRVPFCFCSQNPPSA